MLNEGEFIDHVIPGIIITLFGLGLYTASLTKQSLTKSNGLIKVFTVIVFLAAVCGSFIDFFVTIARLNAAEAWGNRMHISMFWSFIILAVTLFYDTSMIDKYTNENKDKKYETKWRLGGAISMFLNALIFYGHSQPMNMGNPMITGTIDNGTIVGEIMETMGDESEAGEAMHFIFVILFGSAGVAILLSQIVKERLLDTIAFALLTSVGLWFIFTSSVLFVKDTGYLAMNAYPDCVFVVSSCILIFIGIDATCKQDKRLMSEY